MMKWEKEEKRKMNDEKGSDEIGDINQKLMEEKNEAK